MTPKSYTGILSVGGLLALGAQLSLASVGCSSADDNTPDNSAGSGGSAAGSTSTAGTTSEAGTTSTAGGGSTGMAGTTGGSGAPGGQCAATASPAGCSGIRNMMACTMEGQACAELPCGVADVGRRTCNCTAGTWMCTACEFPMDFTACPIMEPPASALPACASGTADTVACSSTRGERCMSGSEVCICWPDDEANVIWDCDSPPAFWAAAAP